MATSRSRKKREVKKPARPRQKRERRAPLSATELGELRERLDAIPVELGLTGRVKAGYQDWYEALFTETGPHPVDQAVHVQVKSGPKLKRQWSRLLAAVRTFRGALSEGQDKLWLGLEPLYLARSSVESVLYYNAGVEAGRAMVVTEASLTERGFNLGTFECEHIFALSSVLSDVARRLPVRGAQ